VSLFRGGVDEFAAKALASTKAAAAAAEAAAATDPTTTTGAAVDRASGVGSGSGGGGGGVAFDVIWLAAAAAHHLAAPGFSSLVAPNALVVVETLKHLVPASPEQELLFAGKVQEMAAAVGTSTTERTGADSADAAARAAMDAAAAAATAATDQVVPSTTATTAPVSRADAAGVTQGATRSALGVGLVPLPGHAAAADGEFIVFQRKDGRGQGEGAAR
jgi:hypothetical protein